MFIVDRNDLISWSQGIYLLREGTSLIAVDEPRCEEAKKRLQKGEMIGLTINNELVSTMQLVNGCYKEKEIEVLM